MKSCISLQIVGIENLYYIQKTIKKRITIIINIISMPKEQVSSPRKRVKNIKNIYIHKIHSLFKLMGDNQQAQQLSCLNNARRTVSAQSKQGLLLQKRKNNKDAARKARLRKKIYMDLLEQIIQKFQKLKQEAKQLEKSSNELLQQLTKQSQIKNLDQIDQYLMQQIGEKEKKDWSQATMDIQRQCKLNKIVSQIQKISQPSQLTLPNFQISLSKCHNSLGVVNEVKKMESIYLQLPQLFSELKNICSDHASIHVLNTKKSNRSESQYDYDPYIIKTLMQEYYSKTICKKNINDIQVSKYLDTLNKIQSFCSRVDQLDS